MKKNIILIISLIMIIGLSFVLYKTLSTTKTQPQTNTEYYDEQFQTNGFSDGLTNPDSEITYPLDDFEPGIAGKNIYFYDINNDGHKDRITKSFYENWNAHSYYTYKIELNQNGKYVDITPRDLRTTNGADCDLQQIQFKFKPHFQIIVIYREMGETWNDETMAHKKTYSFSDGKIIESEPKQMRKICDVKELF